MPTKPCTRFVLSSSWVSPLFPRMPVVRGLARICSSSVNGPAPTTSLLSELRHSLLGIDYQSQKHLDSVSSATHYSQEFDPYPQDLRRRVERSSQDGVAEVMNHIGTMLRQDRTSRSPTRYMARVLISLVLHCRTTPANGAHCADCHRV
jgi:hypothetical protein